MSQPCDDREIENHLASLKDKQDASTIAKDEEKDISASVSSVSTLSLIKRGTFCDAIRGLISEYSNATSIHGIKYFGARNQPWYERIFWFVIVGFSMYLCVDLTLATYAKWRDNPVIVSLAETETPIWEIPFPTVTICPLAKSKREKFPFNEILDVVLNPDSEQILDEKTLKRFESLVQICLANSEHSAKLNFTDKFANESIIYDLKYIAPDLNETIFKATWRLNDLEIEKEIQDVLTMDGLCFSFNQLPPFEIFRNWNDLDKSSYNFTAGWTLEEGYPKDVGITAFPRRVLAGDMDEGFSVMLKASLYDADPECSGKSQGFKIILHTPGEFPRVSKRFFRVPFMQQLLVSIKPNMITTSDKVRTYDPEKRQCFFNSERYLKFFKIYTQGNCEHECLNNATLKHCDCLLFPMPKDQNMKYCGGASISCFKKVRKNLLKDDGFKHDCNCLPDCTSIAYDAEITQSVLNRSTVVESNIFEYDVLTEYLNMTDCGLNCSFYDDPNAVISSMKVFFSNNNFLSSKRSELYGIADLIANIGGLFGLFMGVSILSLVEILYFFTIRLGTNLKRRRHAKEKQEKYSQ